MTVQEMIKRGKNGSAKKDVFTSLVDEKFLSEAFEKCGYALFSEFQRQWSKDGATIHGCSQTFTGTVEIRVTWRKLDGKRVPHGELCGGVFSPEFFIPEDVMKNVAERLVANSAPQEVKAEVMEEVVVNISIGERRITKSFPILKQDVEKFIASFG